LLAGAGALLRTLWVLQAAQPPFDTANVLAIDLPVMTNGRTPDQVHQFYRELRTQIGALPGVESASAGFMVPWRDARGISFDLRFTLDGAPRQNADDDPAGRWRCVSPGFFTTMGIPILQGRDFNDADRNGTDRVVIVSQSIAALLAPGQNPVGRYLHFTDPLIKFAGISGEPRRIIAVVPDFDDGDIVASPAKSIYQPSDQEGMIGRLFVRPKTDPYALVPVITREVRRMASDQPVERASTLADVRAEVMSSDRLNAVIFGGFASLALLISIVGVA